MLPTGEIQRDLLSLTSRYDAACEHTRAFIGRLARQSQNAHAGVVVVQHFSLRRLPDQLFECGA